MTPEQIQEALADPFPADQVGWKPQATNGNRALAICFIDARNVMDRLDAVLGIANWQDTYSPLPDGNVVCTLSLRIGGEWVSKTDIGGPSDQRDHGDKEKAAFSDALKRAAVKWGVGRYLYNLDGGWVDYDAQKKQLVKTPTLPAWALPKAQRPPAKSIPASAKSAANGNKPAPLTGADLIARLEKKYPTGEALVELETFGAKHALHADPRQWTPEAVMAATEHMAQWARKVAAK